MKWFSKNTNSTQAKFTNGKFIFENEGCVTVTLPTSRTLCFLVNNIPVSGKIELNSTDTVSISYQDNIIEEPNVTYTLSVNIHKTEVFLEKKVVAGKYLILKNVDTLSPHLFLQLSEEPLFPSPTNFDEIETLIRHSGYNADFIEENILAICNAESDAKDVVVKATLPVHGKPARFELINGLEDGKIINENQFFAEYVDEVAGIPGRDIFGNEIPAEEIFFFPDFGTNVLVEDRGLMSLRTGRLIFNRNTINIIEESTVQKSLNYEDGTVIFEGDYIIDGDIKEGGQVKCTGNLTVQGGIFDSYVFADGNLTIEGNVDQSVIYAGFSKIAARQIETFSLQFLETFERVMFESSFYADDGLDYSEKTKSLELAKSEFLAIQQTINPFTSLVEQFSNESTIQLFKDFEALIKEGTATVLNDQSSSEDIRTEMERFYEIIKKSKDHLLDELGLLSLTSCNNSHIFAYNNVILDGSGSFQSVIDSNKSISLSGKSIATSLRAEKSIEATEITSGNSNDVKLIVKKRDGHITANSIDSDISLELSSKKYVTDEELKNVHITYSEFPK